MLSFFSSNHSFIDIARGRIIIIIIAFIFAFLTISARLVDIIIFDHLPEKHQHRNNYIANFSRKNILDRNSSLLAVNLKTASLYANPKIISNPKEVAARLANIFPDLNKKKLHEMFSSNKSFVWIKRNITPEQQYAVNNLGVVGLDFEVEQKRIYPHGSLLSHVLGFVGVDGSGLMGIEQFFNANLVTSQNFEEQKNDAVNLSIDVRIQSIVHEELLNVIKKYRALGGVGIVSDVNNGEILAMVSLPDFDPHNPGHAKPKQLFNNAALGTYELGSIFKMYTIALGLESKVAKLNDVYYVREPIKAGRFKIHDYKYKKDWLSLPEIFIYSSNIGTAKITLEVGGKLQKNFMQSLGFFEQLPIELPERGNTIYPKMLEWTPISAMTISYGHGIAITPLHMVRAANSIINGGILHNLTLVKNANNNKEGTRIISNETSDIMKKLFRLTVAKGSGKKAEAPGYFVGGKTGSADKPGIGGYSKNMKISSFFGAFPMYDPKYSVLIMIDSPIPTKDTPFTTGAWTAAPTVGNIVNRIAPILSVKPAIENNEEIVNKLWVDYDPSLEEDAINKGA